MSEINLNESNCILIPFNNFCCDINKINSLVLLFSLMNNQKKSNLQANKLDTLNNTRLKREKISSSP